MKRPSIRWRLTLWYGIVLSAILVGSGSVVYMLMHRELLALTDAALAEELDDLAGDVMRCAGPEDLAAEIGLRYASHDGYESQVSTEAGVTLFRSEGLGPRACRSRLRSPRPGRSSATPGCPTGPATRGWRPGWSPAGAGPSSSLSPSRWRRRPRPAAIADGAAPHRPPGRRDGPRRRIPAGAQGHGTRGSDGGHRPGDHLPPAGSPPVRPRSRRRAGPAGAHLQRHDRAAPALLRGGPALHGRRRPRAEESPGLDAHRGRGRAPRAPLPRPRRARPGHLLEEIDRLSRLVAQLLFLCREDAGLPMGARNRSGSTRSCATRPITCRSWRRRRAWR